MAVKGKTKERLAQAVRNSLNLPRLEVNIRRHRTQPLWRFRLVEDGYSSDWLDLDSTSVTIMQKIGLLPALHLGTFRLAYDAVRHKANVRGTPAA